MENIQIILNRFICLECQEFTLNFLKKEGLFCSFCGSDNAVPVDEHFAIILGKERVDQ